MNHNQPSYCGPYGHDYREVRRACDWDGPDAAIPVPAVWMVELRCLNCGDLTAVQMIDKTGDGTLETMPVVMFNGVPLSYVNSL